MNLEELRTFLEVVETGSLVMAAKRLNVTPSTVSARISGLEEEIGQKLLHRNKSGAELTSPGFKFKRYAEVMLQLWGQARYEVSLPRGFEGVCNVGLDFDLWPGVGQRFLEHLRRHAPGIAVALWPGEQRMIDRWLEIGLVDVAFCHAPPAGGRFDPEGTGAGPLGRLCLCRSRRCLPPPACRRLSGRCDIGAHHRILRLGPGPPPAQWWLGLPATAPCHGRHR
jgi:LysR family transcriptional regulator, flagellar master operon regulator